MKPTLRKKLKAQKSGSKMIFCHTHSLFSSFSFDRQRLVERRERYRQVRAFLNSGDILNPPHFLCFYLMYIIHEQMVFSMHYQSSMSEFLFWFQMLLRVACKLMAGVFRQNTQQKLQKEEKAWCLSLYQFIAGLLILMTLGWKYVCLLKSIINIKLVNVLFILKQRN